MRRTLPLLCLVACAGRPGGDDTGATDTEGPGPSEGLDRDQDGASAEEDCDDLDPRAYPGNAETWDGRDNDCDGVVDGRGAFAGAHTVSATAIVEGAEVEMTLQCPVTIDRTAGTLSFEVRCRPDPGDEDALALLGAEVVVSPVDNAVEAEAWSGTVMWTSSNGWTTTGTGHATWWDMDEVWLTTGLVTVSLEWAGTGSVTRATR